MDDNEKARRARSTILAIAATMMLAAGYHAFQLVRVTMGAEPDPRERFASLVVTAFASVLGLLAMARAYWRGYMRDPRKDYRAQVSLPILPELYGLAMSEVARAELDRARRRIIRADRVLYARMTTGFYEPLVQCVVCTVMIFCLAADLDGRFSAVGAIALIAIRLWDELAKVWVCRTLTRTNERLARLRAT